jgi:2-polyprenyl-3-methyl-5-hydroxy-6-metoxy-1,4-benzoquinol methylase
MTACDLCGADNPREVLQSPNLDGPLVQCRNCGFQYVGERHSQLTFGSGTNAAVAQRVQAANFQFQNLRLEEEHRLALLNARWRLDLIRQFRTTGKLLEVGCARGDFLSVARDEFDVHGVEPNPELAADAKTVAPIHQDVIETLPLRDFDVIVSFHVIEHVDSPKRFVEAMAERIKPGGLLVLETPDIHSLPFRIMGSKWRQFIPEHYFFFDQVTLAKLLHDCGFNVKKTRRIGKHASAAFIMNRLSRYFRFLGRGEDLAGRSAVSKLTFRINPLDIMIAFAEKRR